MSRSLLAITVGALLLLSVPSASAQEQGQGRRGGGGAFGQAFQNLTDEDREVLRQFREETRDETQKLREAQAALNNAICADKKNEDDIKAKVADVAKALEKLAFKQADAIAKLKPSANVKDVIRSGAGAFMGGFGGRGGPGGGGRRGGNNP